MADQEGREAEPEAGVGVAEQEDVADQPEDQGDQQPDPACVVGRAEGQGGDDEADEDGRLRPGLGTPVAARDGVPVDEREHRRQRPRPTPRGAAWQACRRRRARVDRMNVSELLADALGRVREQMPDVVAGLSDDDLAWRPDETGDACFDVDDVVQHRHKNKRAGLFQNSRELAVQLREKATGLGCFDRMSFDHCAHHRGDQRCADAIAVEGRPYLR